MTKAMLEIIRLLFVSVLIATSSATLADNATESAFCDRLLPLDIFVPHLGDKASGVMRKAAGPRAESADSCSRVYAQEKFDRFSDELIFLVTPFSTPDGAKRALESIAKDGANAFGFSRPQGIGNAAVHFRRPDPLSSMRLELNMSFVQGKYLVELKYQSVDDGKQNKFVHSSSELEPLAKAIANHFASPDTSN